MNSEREFVDLDKVVKEGQMKKPASGATTGARPATRGRFMDVVRPGAQVRPVSGNNAAAAKPAPSLAPKTDVKNGPLTGRRRMDMVAPTKKTTVLKPVAAPTKTQAVRPVASVAPKPQPPKERPQPPKERSVAPRPNLFSDDDFAKDEKTPDANNFSLGGRSPFIRDAKVDKRPLGPNVPESNAGAIRSTKNVYSQKTPLKSGLDDMPGRSVITVAPPKKKSGWLWALVTLGVIAAGGGIGLLAFMIFAQN